jgi:hypothetical protein
VHATAVLRSVFTIHGFAYLKLSIFQTTALSAAFRCDSVRKRNFGLNYSARFADSSVFLKIASSQSLLNSALSLGNILALDV